MSPDEWKLSRESMLINQITSAFKDVVLADGISLNMTEYIDGYETEPDFLERAKKDERDDWQRIPDELLEEFTGTFSFTDLKGFRFYIPAYMIWTIRNHEISDSIISDHTVYALNINHHVFRDISMLDWFTPAQISAILAFMKYCADHPDSFDTRYVQREIVKIKEQM